MEDILGWIILLEAVACLGLVGCWTIKDTIVAIRDIFDKSRGPSRNPQGYRIAGCREIKAIRP